MLTPPDPDSATPPFEQLRSQVARQVASGELPAGERLPTVRALAAELGVAPGTVARAFKELEADGVVETRGRAGTFVSSTGRADDPAVARAVRDLVAVARRAGLTRAEAVQALDAAWGA